MIPDDARWKAFMAKPDALTLQNDPAYAAASLFLRNYNSKFGIYRQQFMNDNDELSRLYLKGH